jgi:repressor LexA
MLDFIQSHTSENGYPPSIREIGSAVGISSTSVVNYNLNRLVDEGYLSRDQNVSRGIRITEKLSRATGKAVDAVAETFRVPLVGRIFASEPVPLPSTDSAMFGIEDALDISRDMLPANTQGLFALEVKGDSMIDAMVNDGDIVVMRRDPDWRNGDMVAIWMEDKEETTLKHVYREGGRLRLQPANPTMSPIFVENPEHVKVQGKVMLVVRQME